MQLNGGDDWLLQAAAENRNWTGARCE